MTYTRRTSARRAAVELEKRHPNLPWWRWIATARNGIKLGWSEYHTKRSAARNATELLFGEDTTVILREPGKPDRVLRHAVCQCGTCTEHREAAQ